MQGRLKVHALLFTLYKLYFQKFAYIHEFLKVNNLKVSTY
uniref:Uncharacterized protein n=1 Tax=Myoviridae sp. ctbEa13 TaxID=2825136 RepID=A0A8S5VBG1_9CAUD|nr:MAG TPA: hypothetical protein [Myoviridae sp. ctbEa13]